MAQCVCSMKFPTSFLLSQLGASAVAIEAVLNTAPMETEEASVSTKKEI